MKLKKTLVMVLAACLLVGTLAGTAFAGPAVSVDYGEVVTTSGYSTVKGTILPEFLQPAVLDSYIIVGYDSNGGAIAIPEMVNFTGWMLTEGGNWGYYKNGAKQYHWQQIDGAWYYFEPVYGYMIQRGVRWIENRLYVFDPSGKCVTQQGFYNIPTYFYVWDPAGNPFAYYPENGVARFYLNENGYIQTGWNYLNDGTGYHWYMCDANYGYLLTNEWFVGEGGYWYYFDENSHMVTGWQTVVDHGVHKTFYFQPNGVLHWGWLNLDGNYYYLSDIDASRIEGCFAFINGFWYLFDDDGVMQTGWVEVELDGGIIRYENYIDVNDGNAIKTRPVYGKYSAWFYFYPWGAMATGDVYLDGQYYYFNEDYTSPFYGQLGTLDENGNFVKDLDTNKIPEDYLVDLESKPGAFSNSAANDSYTVGARVVR